MVTHAFSKGIPLKKKYGQHFLRSDAVVQEIVDAVELDITSSVFEIGCGDGFLTRAILQKKIARLWVFEIDPDWVKHVQTMIEDERLSIFEENILDMDFERLQEHKPWTLLANLPYQVTFPILFLLQKNRALLKEGVVMVQEEVAQKIVKTSGRGYGYTSLFLQRYFSWTLLSKVSPQMFHPAPKVYSRLMHFVPKKDVQLIENEEGFWKFIKICFAYPRRTLRNNLAQSHYDMSKVSEETLALRSQQMRLDDFIMLWNIL